MLSNREFAVLHAVAETRGVELRAVKSTSRRKVFAAPRFAAMKLYRGLFGQSYPYIGRLFQRDHATVISGVRKAEKLCDQDPDYAFLYGVARQKALDRISRLGNPVYLPDDRKAGAP